MNALKKNKGKVRPHGEEAHTDSEVGEQEIAEIADPQSNSERITVLEEEGGGGEPQGGVGNAVVNAKAFQDKKNAQEIQASQAGWGAATGWMGV